MKHFPNYKSFIPSGADKNKFNIIVANSSQTFIYGERNIHTIKATPVSVINKLYTINKVLYFLSMPDDDFIRSTNAVADITKARKSINTTAIKPNKGPIIGKSHDIKPTALADNTITAHIIDKSTPN